MAAPRPSHALYIHWPFCLAKCPYCDFNSHVRDQVDQQQWANAYGQEWDHLIDRLCPEDGADSGDLGPIRLHSIFFGGGTPSLMAPETLAAIMGHIRRRAVLTNDCEITLEANPTSAEIGKFRAYRDAGVNRLSIGIQSFDTAALAFLGRQHSVAEARKALDAARQTFDRFSFDLIYARPDQSLNAWRAELAEALAYDPGHLSLYQLTIEPGTAFHTKARLGQLRIPSEQRADQLFALTQDITGAAGLLAYEISNHARPGQESRHNLSYWRYQPTLGLGPGAHARFMLPDGRWIAQQRLRSPEQWLTAVARSQHSTDQEQDIAPTTRFEEMILMGLRLRQGLRFADLALHDAAQSKALQQGSRTTTLVESGDLEAAALAQGLLACTEKGRKRLNAVIAYLLQDLA